MTPTLMGWSARTGVVGSLAACGEAGSANRNGAVRRTRTARVMVVSGIGGRRQVGGSNSVPGRRAGGIFFAPVSLRKTGRVTEGVTGRSCGPNNKPQENCDE